MGLRQNVLQGLAIILIATISLLGIIASIDGNNDRLAFACSCIEIKSPQAEYEQSNAVFSGKVVDLETTDELYPSKVATFDVYTVWKGISQDSATITTGMGGADCGYPFVENVEYLVYAYGEGSDGLGASSCSQTKPLNRAEADLVAIGQGNSTFARDSVEVYEERWRSNPYSYLIGIGAAIAGVIAFLTLRKRK